VNVDLNIAPSYLINCLRNTIVLDTNMNSHLTHLTKNQQLVQTIMFMDPSKIPDFPLSPEIEKLGLQLKEMFACGHLTTLCLDGDGEIVCF